MLNLKNETGLKKNQKKTVAKIKLQQQFFNLL